ncbi:prepilin-type N-terminal cleavage/methylation domain-containing protein [Methylophilus medardicus]|uniref:Prepilin-type N-terminal cleavage/methylation domain-containing protein n=1 Tax=Methylophilus medardicus TaxID=2588534 RepID=A0A5B8CQN6_9PROT|nr:prepilin-type N-terminal cleavage/methylation domain-containing protein [Methylophilus medardicus]QDC43574.1 prepilin-type N-terminal cleavage/methylation domain-containing protein [Methylophilus medardicus]QDC48581.1 prepilin-type N-terminal cleavage/methylation domain-containing protein [Methylophilus medardicus]QDC52286.1 prepilin-type N-terminal cleavage/methylation domain-containing protein [Methylophilus medardicus]
MMRLPTNKKLHGFTLVELLVTLALLALLVTSASPVVQLNTKREKERELKRALWQIRDALDAYKDAVDQGLIKKTAEGSGYPPNLTILVTGVENAQATKKKKLFFLRRIPRDPFAVDSNQSNVATWRIRGYDGAIDDMAQDVYDVSSRSSAIGINQQPYSEW